MDKITKTETRLECDPYLGFVERVYVSTLEVKRLKGGKEAILRTLTCNGYHRHSDFQGIGKPGECEDLRRIYREKGLSV